MAPTKAAQPATQQSGTPAKKPHKRQPLNVRPRFGRIATAERYCDRPRARLYEWAGDNPGLFVKDGNTTLVDFDVLDTILDALRVVVIKPASEQPAKKAKAAAAAAEARAS